MKPKTIFLFICGLLFLSHLVIFSVPLMDWLLRFSFEELHYRLVGVVLAVVLGITQLLLCFLTKRIPIRLIPIYIILLGYLFCLNLLFGMEGLGEYIAAMIFGIMFSIALSGIIIAWLIFGIYRLIIHFKRQPRIQ